MNEPEKESEEPTEIEEHIPNDSHQTSSQVPIINTTNTKNDSPSPTTKLKNNIFKKPKRNTSPAPIYTINASKIQSLEALFAAVTTSKEKELPTVTEAVKGDREDREKWMGALKREYGALEKTNTLIPVTPEIIRWVKDYGIKIHGTRVILSIKTRYDGSIDRYKVRIVCQGYSMIKGLDFFESYAPCARLSGVRTFISLACTYNWDISHLDVPNAYLYGYSSELILVRIPECWEEITGQKLSVNGVNYCIMNRSLYGNPEAGKLWNSIINDFIISLGFKRCNHDPSIYALHDGDENLLVMITLWVDDIFITGPSKEHTRLLKEEFRKTFNTKDSGRLEQAVGLHFSWSSGGCTIRQTKHIDLLLKKFNLSKANPTSSPWPTNSRPSADMSPKNSNEIKYMENKNYRSLIGGLLYMALGSRPDIAFHVGCLARHCENPGPGHWKLATHVLKYLSGTKNQGLFFPYSLNSDVTPDPLQSLDAFHDSSWSDQPKSKSSGGFIIRINGSPVNWMSKLLPRIAQSTTDAEIMEANVCSRDVMWFRQVLQFCFPKRKETLPTKIYGDNNNQIEFTRQDKITDKTKHMLNDYFYVRQLFKEKQITPLRVPSKNNISDIMTKNLPTPILNEHKISIRLIDDPKSHEEFLAMTSTTGF